MARRMSALVRKVNTVLESRLKDYRSDLRRGIANGRVLGYIVSSNFDGLEHSERQKILDDILQAELTPKEYEEVGPIVTMTPAEASLKETA
jgi:hypothetical protein